MAKVSVFIEEHLVKEVVVDVPDELNMDERMTKAEELVRERFDNGDVVVTTDDYSGTRLIMIHDHRANFETEWVNY